MSQTHNFSKSHWWAPLKVTYNIHFKVNKVYIDTASWYLTLLFCSGLQGLQLLILIGASQSLWKMMQVQHLESFQLIQNGIPKDCGNALYIDCGTCMCVIVTNFKHFVCGVRYMTDYGRCHLITVMDLGNRIPGYCFHIVLTSNVDLLCYILFLTDYISFANLFCKITKHLVVCFDIVFLYSVLLFLKHFIKDKFVFIDLNSNSCRAKDFDFTFGLSPLAALL